MSDYEIRQYQPKDKDEILSLYETVFGGNKGEDWFDWKYGDNPYIDHVPMFVATYRGKVIGSRPFFVLPVVINEEYDVALQPGDAMVHPDHRRQGLFSRMMEKAIDKYSNNYPFYFTFPNNLSGPAHIKHGGKHVSNRSSYYRVENPAGVAKSRTSRNTIRFISKIGTPVAKGYYRIRDLTISEGSEIIIRTESKPPAEQLASLYRNSIPDQIHAHRDEQFYQWRFENPDWEYTTYIADSETDPVAAIVTGTSVGSGLTTTKLTDVVPLQNQPNHALVSLIGQILSDHSETDLFVAPPQGFPESILRSFGFHTDDTPPLSFVASQTTHVVRPLSNGWKQNGQDLTDQKNWLMTHVEEDTS